MWTELLEDLAKRKEIEANRFRLACRAVIDQQVTEAQIIAFLVLLRAKGESSQDLMIFAKEILKNSLDLKLQDSVIDVCGTGGGKIRRDGTFNISTISSLVLSSLGIKVCKHGGSASTSTSGSADLLTALGIEIKIPPAKINPMIELADWAFCFGPMYHPQLAHLGPIRKQLKLTTSLNIVLPIINPGLPQFRLLGISDPNCMQPIAEIIRDFGVSRGIIVCGQGFLDEFTLDGTNSMVEIADGKIKRKEFNLSDKIGYKSKEKHINGGNPMLNARIALEVLNGVPSKHLDTIALNTGAAMYICGQTRNIESGFLEVKNYLQEGSAQGIIEKIKRAQTHLDLLPNQN